MKQSAGLNLKTLLSGGWDFLTWFPCPSLLTHTGFCGHVEVVTEIHSVTLQCCEDADCLQIITPCASLSGLNLKRSGSVVK